MRAAVLHRFGEPLVVSDLDKPTAGPGEVLVRVAASGANPLDLKIAAGQGAHAAPELPAVLGLDMAGTVEAVGHGVADFAPGDAVFGMTGGVGGVPGSLAEYVVADARLLARSPSSLTAREAAAIPLAAITAWEGLVDRANVRAGHTVLVHGGAGGVGHLAVQIARARGARVFATGAPRSLETIASLGATPIDYTSTPVGDYVAEYTDGEGFDIVYDTVGGDALDQAFVSVKVHTGHAISALGRASYVLAPLSLRGATYSGVFTLLPLLTGRGRAHHGEIVAAVASMVDAGEVRPILNDARFTLDTVEDAHRAVADPEVSGKIVVEVG